MVVIFLTSCGSKDVNKSKLNITNDDSFKIEQKKEYVNPDLDVSQLKKPENPGPHNGKTYIDDAGIKTIGDLKKHYPLPADYKYSVLNHKDKSKQPIIATPDNKAYSFIVEEGYLMYDTKKIIEKNGKKKAKFETTEIKRK